MTLMRRSAATLYAPPPASPAHELRARLSLLAAAFDAAPEAAGSPYARRRIGEAVDALGRYEQGGDGIAAENAIRLARDAILDARVSLLVPAWVAWWPVVVDRPCDKWTHDALVADPERFAGGTKFIGYQDLGGEWGDLGLCRCGTTLCLPTGRRVREWS